VAGGLATTLGWTALTAPEAQAAGTVEVTGITTRTLHGDDPTTVQAWQRIDITANWTDKNPTAGDTISLALGEGLRWPGGVDFQLTKKGDENVKIGDCAVHEADKTLICTLNDTVEQWESIDDGELTIHAQMTDKMVGKTQTTVTVNGTDFTVIPGDDNNDGTCDISCDGVIPKKADPNSFKIGWLSRVNDDGSYVWTWEVNVSGATSYKVVDQGGDYRYVECTDSDWGHYWRPQDAAYNEETRTVTWTTAAATPVATTLRCPVTNSNRGSDAIDTQTLAFKGFRVFRAIKQPEKDYRRDPTVLRARITRLKMISPANQPTNRTISPATTRSLISASDSSVTAVNGDTSTMGRSTSAYMSRGIIAVLKNMAAMTRGAKLTAPWGVSTTNPSMTPTAPAATDTTASTTRVPTRPVAVRKSAP